MDECALADPELRAALLVGCYRHRAALREDDIFRLLLPMVAEGPLASQTMECFLATYSVDPAMVTRAAARAWKKSGETLVGTMADQLAWRARQEAKGSVSPRVQP